MRRISAAMFVLLSGLAVSASLLRRQSGPPVSDSVMARAPTVRATVRDASGALLPSATGSFIQEPAAPPGRILPTLALVLDELHAEPDSTRCDDVVQLFVDGLALDHIAGVLAALEASPGSEAARGVHVRLVRRWADLDPQGAAAHAMSLPRSPLRRDALESVGLAWVEGNADEAIIWARQLRDREEREQVLVSVGYEVARHAPVTALAVAGSLEAGPARDDLLVHAAAQWASMQPAAAAEWACRLPDRRLRERILVAVATLWADVDPARAAALALQSLPAGRQRDDAVAGIVQRWRRRPPDRPPAARSIGVIDS